MEKVIRSTLLSIQAVVHEQNINPTHKAIVLSEFGEELPVYCKETPPREIFIECAIALLGRDLGISIPKPYLIFATPETYPILQEPTLLFGSESIEYPNLFRKINQQVDEALILPMLTKHDKQNGIVVFDEWTANTDRHFGNILFGGTEKFYFIDHEYCVPIGVNVEQEIGRNRLLDSLKLAYQDDKSKTAYLDYCILNHIQRYATQSTSLLAQRTFAMDFLPIDEVNYVENFLKNRVIYIANLLHKRLKIAQQKLPWGVIH